MPFFHPSFAFDFASMGMLWWGALGGIPIVIHLLHKRKYRETTWAAMRFLIAAARKNSRRIRIEQLILLMVRVLILILLACALAQPYMTSLGSFFQADAPVHRIIVIDASFSMAYERNDLSRFDLAKDAARRIVDGSRQGDAFNLVRIGEMLPRTIVRKATFQKSQVQSEIDNLPQSHEYGNLAATLEDVSELLGEAGDIEQKEIILISDFQRATWAPSTSAGRARIRSLLQDLASAASVSFLDVGESSAPNLAVTSFTANEAFVTAGRSMPLTAGVTNFGSGTVSNVMVELHVDGRLVQTKPVDLPPDEEIPVDFNYTFAGAGEHRLEVRLPGDDLAIDNHRYLSLPVKEQLNVLLVNGKPAGRPSDNATFYVEKALRPRTQSRPWEGVTRPTVIRETELLITEVDRYDCIVLCNITQFTPEEAMLLKNYTESGGGLVICLGDQTRVQNYNQVLYDEGQGVLPVKLRPAIGDADNPDPDSLFFFDPADLRHPIVNLYEGNPDTGLANTFVFRFFPTEIPADSRVTRVLNFANPPQPAILESPLGQGRVVLLTTSVDNKWGAWPLQPQTSFLPIMHETIRFAVAGRWSDRQERVGEAIRRKVRAFNVPITIRKPDGTEESTRPAESNRLAEMTFAGTNLSGIYEIEFGAPLNRTEVYAVNIDPKESPLGHVGEEELTDDLLPGVDFEYLTRWQDGPRRSDGSSVDRGGLSRWLLMAVLVLVLVELLMAWRFSYGFALLVGVVVIVMVRQFFAMSPAVTTGVLLVLLAGAAFYITRHRPQVSNS